MQQDRHSPEPTPVVPLLLKKYRPKTMLIEAKPFVVSDPHLDVARYNGVAACFRKTVKPWDIAFPNVIGVR
jgi:hypothetical protein